MDKGVIMPKIIDDSKVFQAALRILATRGYAKAATKEIAEAAQVDESTLFRKYGTKAQLMALAIEQELAQVPLAHVTYTGDIKADLLNIIKAYLKTHEMLGNIIPILILELPQYPEIRQMLKQPWANIQGVANIMAMYQRDGKLKKAPPLTCFMALLGPIIVSKLPGDLDMVSASVSPLDIEAYLDTFLCGWHDG